VGCRQRAPRARDPVRMRLDPAPVRGRRCRIHPFRGGGCAAAARLSLPLPLAYNGPTEGA
jgi:hypothetical protein